jgi:hypothetical protein
VGVSGHDAKDSESDGEINDSEFHYESRVVKITAVDYDVESGVTLYQTHFNDGDVKMVTSHVTRR